VAIAHEVYLMLSDVLADGERPDDRVRMRLATGSSQSILVVPVPGDGYEPRAGDVWVAGVLRPAGVPVGVPAGWTATGQVPGVVDEPTGRVGDLALFYRLLHDGAPDPFAAAVEGPVWARGVLRVYRGEGQAVAAATADLKGCEDEPE